MHIAPRLPSRRHRPGRGPFSRYRFHDSPHAGRQAMVPTVFIKLLHALSYLLGRGARPQFGANVVNPRRQVGISLAAAADSRTRQAPARSVAIGARPHGYCRGTRWTGNLGGSRSRSRFPKQRVADTISLNLIQRQAHLLHQPQSQQLRPAVRGQSAIGDIRDAPMAPSLIQTVRSVPQASAARA